MKWFEREQLRVAWRWARRTVFDPEHWRRLVTRNFALKLLSLLIAFGLWAFVNFGERDTEESLKVPLELRNIPAHLMITSPRVDFIDARVIGPRTLLRRIDRNRLSIALDLNGIRPGPAVFRVGVESLNLPRGVKVVRINPAQVTLELERVGHKSVPVRLHLVGKPPPDVQLIDTKVSPETVQVTGPASDVDDLHVVSTEPLDISAATAGTIERELPLESAGEYLSLSANRVAAQVRLEEISISRDFKRVPIAVRNAAQEYRLAPDTARIVVRGSKRVVDDFELPKEAVYVDATDLGQGEHVVKALTDLPPGIEVVSLEPSEVKLTLWTRKRSIRKRGRAAGE
jgi:YbbR domain-containing protein